MFWRNFRKEMFGNFCEREIDVESNTEANYTFSDTARNDIYLLDSREMKSDANLTWNKNCEEIKCRYWKKFRHSETLSIGTFR